MPLGAASRPRARLASCEGRPGATNAVTSSAERTSAEAEGSGLLRRVITGGLLRSSLLSGDEVTSQCLLRRMITAGLLRPSLLRGDEATSQCPRADSIGRGGGGAMRQSCHTCQSDHFNSMFNRRQVGRQPSTAQTERNVLCLCMQRRHQCWVHVSIKERGGKCRAVLLRVMLIF